MSDLQEMSKLELDDIGGRLGAMYDQAEQLGDQELCLTIRKTWTVVQANAGTTAIAASAIEGLIEAVKQRDEVLGELNELNEGIDDLETMGFTENARLQNAVETVMDMAHESFLESGLHLSCPGCAASDMGWYDTVAHDDINDLCYALFTVAEEEVPLELRQELGDLLDQWCTKWNAHLKAEAARHKTAVIDLDDEPETAESRGEKGVIGNELPRKDAALSGDEPGRGTLLHALPDVLAE